MGGLKIYFLCLFILFPSLGLAKTIQVTDALRREVRIKVPVQRAIFLIAYEFIPYLDLWDQTVGVSLWAKRESDLLKLYPQRLKGLRAVGTATNPNLEAITSLNPDLIITWTYFPKAVKVLSFLGIPTLALAPESLADVFKTLDLLAKVFARKEEGLRVQRAMKHLLKFLTDRLSSTPRPRVLFLWNTPTRVSGKYGVVPDLIRVAGGKNCSDELDLPYATVSVERIVIWDPEVIFIWGNARYDEKTILQDSRLATLAAVKERRVYKLPPWSTWSPRSVLLALWMAKRLHPERIDQASYERQKRLFEQEVLSER